jgi:hypothetical protein
MANRHSSKLVSFILSVTSTLYFTNTRAYCKIRTLQIHNVFIMKAPGFNLIILFCVHLQVLFKARFFDYMRQIIFTCIKWCKLQKTVSNLCEHSFMRLTLEIDVKNLSKICHTFCI